MKPGNRFVSSKETVLSTSVMVLIPTMARVTAVGR
ncbi:hypothetical protein PAECIP111892_03729 [Paenibacillus auburnensis]|uniref:Uncharacterized protein n=1 Tax=Paenibacillus auburnensis TaxID=2905649 RepID=A0ABN8GLW6_9BACL|nr:hypothetical protein PAECIP111892_03729 [Paenibacillus auburnensis]